jgi:hypothetical protein
VNDEVRQEKCTDTSACAYIQISVCVDVITTILGVCSSDAADA